MRSSVHLNNKKDILILGKDSTQGLGKTTSTAETEYLINFSEQRNKFCLSLNYNGSNSYLFVYGVKIYQFKSKDSESNIYLLCLGNISKDFTIDNMKKRTTWICIWFFSWLC